MVSPSQGLTVQQLLQTAEFPLLKQFIKKNPYTAGNYKTARACDAKDLHLEAHLHF